jgi:hypothetical protein
MNCTGAHDERLYWIDKKGRRIAPPASLGDLSRALKQRAAR